MHQPPADLRHFQSLVTVMSVLRSPTGCPWDREQDHRTLAPYAIEEAHELAEAIESSQLGALIEELGDLLLQVVFHAQLGAEAGTFTIEDVIESINTKMVRRHPHVFSDTRVSGSEEVLKNWGQIKAAEKGDSAQKKTFNIPVALPALQRAHKIGEKTHQTRFDWSNVKGVLEKLREEMGELIEAIDEKSQAEQEHELGDVLFTLAQVGRHLKIEPEGALRKTNMRFETRYEKMLEIAKGQNLIWDSLNTDQMEKLWVAAKESLK